MEFSPTHPRDAWRPTPMTIAEFQSAMTDACHNYYGDTSRNKIYDKMRVLVVHWEVDETWVGGLQIANQARRIHEVFERSYGYTVESLSLKNQDPDPNGTFSFNLRRLLHGLKEDDLAIVYYIGHGDRDPNAADGTHRLLLTPSDVPGRPPQWVDFQEVRTQIIDPSPADVLILLDCCAAAGGGIGHRKELIAASAFDKNTQTGPESFTSILVQQLQHAIDSRHILSTAQLYNRMATLHLIRPGGIPKLNAMPYFLQNSGATRMPIMLAPNMAHETWTPGPVVPLFRTPVNVVLHVHLRDANAATFDQMKHWLLVNRPHNVRRVEIKSVFPSLSMIFIIIVTLDVWYSLRNHPAISFIGFEINTNANPQNNPVLQATQSKKIFDTVSKGSSAGNQKENQPLK
ncbi:hypothetical protein NW754_015637 [Fusarium falciforme]|nr:hypothetical protein NW754_015637 [Fusarium falciforme]KAJ4246121.1 hypothetical protein NW757_009576 [Fusarium falciforme]